MIKMKSKIKFVFHINTFTNFNDSNIFRVIFRNRHSFKIFDCELIIEYEICDQFNAFFSNLDDQIIFSN